jgi:co-chaperonin GroES (HSP10)
MENKDRWVDAIAMGEKILVKIHRPRLGHYIKDSTKIGEKIIYNLMTGKYKIGADGEDFNIEATLLTDLRLAEENASTIAKVIAVGEVAFSGLTEKIKPGDYVIITKYGGEFVPNLAGGLTRYKVLRDKDINLKLPDFKDEDYNDSDDDVATEDYCASTVAAKLEELAA